MISLPGTHPARSRRRALNAALAFMLGIALSGCTATSYQQPYAGGGQQPYAGGAPQAAGANTLTVINGTGEYALVRIKTYDTVTRAELSIAPGGEQTCHLPNGDYYEVVRLGRTPEEYYYAKGEGFELEALWGQYIQASLTLHGVIDGNYANMPATVRDFQ